MRPPRRMKQSGTVKSRLDRKIWSGSILHRTIYHHNDFYIELLLLNRLLFCIQAYFFRLSFETNIRLNYFLMAPDALFRHYRFVQYHLEVDLFS